MYVSPLLCSCLLSVDRTSVWTCPIRGDEQCSFFLWVEDEAAAKEPLGISQLPPVPQTPAKTGNNCGEPNTTTDSGTRDQRSLPQLPDTPFTRAKRKRVSIDTAERDGNDHGGNKNLHRYEGSLQAPMAPNDPFTHSRQPSARARKAAKTSALPTPGRAFTERLKNYTASLPTPNSEGRISAG